MTIKAILTGALVALLGWFGLALDAGAANLRVPSEYPTIQSAIDASVDGDVVLVAAGEYTGAGNRDLDPGTREITILGEGGPEETVIDCEGQGRGLWVHGGQTEAFQFVGFTVRRGAASDDGGFRVELGSRVTILDCVFENCSGNYHAFQGDGVVRRTKFSECSAEYAVDWRTGVIEDCQIVDNSGCGVIVAHSYVGELLIDRTLIAGNGSGGVWLGAEFVATTMSSCVIANGGEAMILGADQLPITIRETTIAGSGVINVLTGTVRFERCLLSGLECGGLWNYETVVMTCCLFDPAHIYGGAEVFVEGGETNADPMFCDPVDCWEHPTRSDWFLHEDSPCLPENSPCGQQIGAFGVGCGITSVGGSAAIPDAGIVFTSAMPARDVLRFQLRPTVTGASSFVGVSGPVGLEIVTLTGRRIASRTLPGDSADAEFEWRPAEDGIRMDSGIYFLRATGANGAATAAKFVWLN